MVSEFVDSVNSVLQVQEETSRVEEVMTKIIGYAAVDVASDFKEVRVLLLYTYACSFTRSLFHSVGATIHQTGSHDSHAKC